MSSPQQIKELFDAAFDLAPEERERFLVKECNGDFRLFAEVQKLFATNDDEPEFLETPPSITHLSELSSARMTDVVSGRRIGHYQLIRVIGRGGMARVFLAQRADDSFEKQVAIKLAHEHIYNQATRDRFLQERNILARLEHPYIARLLDGGTTENDEPYFVMEVVDGLAINQYCQKLQLTITARLQLFRQVCEAVQYAHQNLIVHRDLKPSNILVTPEGTPKLLDFGIAKLLETDEASSALTKTQFPFTPEYASPEQVNKQPINTATDIYSLGVLLYELLTGKKPYDLKKLSLSQIAHVISEADPAPPKLDYELDNILQRALRKEPAARYNSVEQFSEDLRRYLAGEPVLARPTSFVYRAGKFLKKNKTSVALAAILLITLLSILVTSIRQNIIAKEQARLQRRNLYAAEMQQAAQAWRNEDILRTRKTLEHWLPQSGTEDLRGFEWNYLWQLVHPEAMIFTMQDEISHLALLPDTQKLYIRDASGNRKVFDTVSGQELWAYKEEAAQTGEGGWAYNGEVFALESGNRAVIWDVIRGAKKIEITEAGAPLQKVTDLNEKLFVTIDVNGTVKVRERATGSLLHTITGVKMPITAMSAIDTNKAIALVSRARDVTIQPFDTNAKAIRFSVPSDIKNIGVDDLRHRLFIHIGDGLAIHDSRNGQLIKKLHPKNGEMTGYYFSNGTDVLFYSTSDQVIHILAAQSLREIGTLQGHQRNLLTQVFYPKDNLYVTSSDDRTAKIWDIGTQKTIATFRGHTGSVICAVLSSDQKKLITGSQDHTARIWDVAASQRPEILQGHTDHILTAAFAPDNKHIASAGKDSIAIISELETGAQQILRGHQDMIYAVAYSPDGKILATGSNDGTAKLWDSATGKELLNIRNGTREYVDGVRSLTFTSDGKQLIAGCNDGMIKVWAVNSGTLLTQFLAHQSPVLSVTLSPDGKRLASGGWDRNAKLWDTTSWQELAILKGHLGHIWSTEFSPDGKVLATGSGDFTIKLWDVATAKILRTMEGHNDGIFSVAFSPDGKRLASSSDDKTVRLWNPSTGEELLTLRDHTDEVWRVAFSPNGKILASASWDKTIRIRRSAENIKLLQ